jgi:hypothetical protein
MKEATGKFKVRVGDGTSWVIVCDEVVDDVRRPLETPG